MNTVAVAKGIYPSELLRRGETGLCLFAAAFLGENDAIHMADAGMTVTCVDYDGPRLYEMRGQYPQDWEFIVADAWRWAGHLAPTGPWFDVASVDPFTGDTGDRALDDLGLWCSLARRLVTITASPRATLPRIPDGWKLSEILPRSQNANWLVLTRD